METVGIVDDDDAIRDSLEALLGASGHPTRGFKNANEFLYADDTDQLGCLLLDVRLPDADGISVLEQLVSTSFLPPVVIITGHGDIPMAVRAMHIGAADFVEKPFDPDAMLNIVANAIAEKKRRRKKEIVTKTARDSLAKLTPRETDVMRKLVIGQPNKIIAAELGVSPRTVELHRARVMEKTEAESLSHLVRIAIAAGINAEDEAP